MSQNVRISYTGSDGSLVCYATKTQLKTYGIDSNNNYIYLSFGSKTLKLRISLINERNVKDNRLYLSQNTSYYTGIPDGTIFQIRKAGENNLELGPFIGVFINNERYKDLVKGKRFFEYTEYQAACKALNGLCCFFSPDCIDWHNHNVKGFYKKGTYWEVATFPLPKFIYNRNVENNCLPESLALINKLGTEGQMLNATPKISKWDTIDTLQSLPQLKEIIPDTTPYNSYSEVEKILERHACVYLKPNLLSKGRGIFKLSKTSDGQYRIEYRTTEANHVANLDNLNVLDSLMSKYTEVGGGYIVQKEIEKAQFKGNPFDLRVLFQKNFQGNWEISGIVGRIGAEGSIITSPRSGGEVENFTTILQEITGSTESVIERLISGITNLGRKICLVLEDKFGISTEFGLDMAIDKDLRIWLIEVNSKPLRVSLKMHGDAEVMSRCSRRPIEYITLLEGFKSWDTILKEMS